MAPSQKASSQKQLILTVAGLCVLWYTTSLLTDTLNKKVQTSFPFPVTLTLLQFLCGTLVNFFALRVVGLGEYQPVVTKHVPILAVLTLCWTSGFLLTNLSFGRVAVSFTHAVKATEPLFVVILCYLINGDIFPLAVYFSLFPIVIGIILVCLNEVSFQVLGLIFAAGSNVAFGTRSVVSKTLFGSKAYDNFNLFLHISTFSALLTLPIWYYMEYPGLVDYEYKPEDIDFLYMAIGNGVCHCAYNQFSFMILARINPLAHSVINAARRFFVIMVSVIIFGSEFNFMNGVGTFTLMCGVFLYGQSKSRVSPPQKRE